MRNPPGSDLLVAGGLAVGHGAAPVCAPVDLRLSAGRALAVVGPNGSGKSTLLRTLVGLLEPLAGTVTLAGASVDERSAAFRRDVAAVLDDDSFFVSLTGREHLLLTARGHGVAAAEEVVAAEIEAFGLAERADALPSALSSGQRRRLALAAAFVRPARLLVLDEPERRLDAGMRTRLAARLGGLRDAGTAVLFASHDAELVGTVADEVLVVDDDACRVLAPAEAAGRIAEL
ncbi:ABC transporter [Geodermatophilus africanus]|uniref:ABC transporter n=1 Tax=Geodermatophilus africanus TaxID=1137993 RepID=A0A1H3AWM3_9ACTN|nr:ABC transporter ATP-binding protein [Geodermatophilus africanus]SDX34005.1 ABC transporter [Geodermatophilus africanus]